jgi:cytochrome c oxidase subunit 2
MMLSKTMFNLLAQLAPSTRPSEHGFFYPIQGSTIAQDVDPLAWFIHGMSIFFTVGIIAVTVYFVIRYRSSVHPTPEPPGHNNVLEVVWTAIPAVIVFVCFFWGFRVYMKMTVQQPGANRVECVGFQWDWKFLYDNPKTGKKVTMKELYLVVDKPVEIDLNSTDVLHALFIPVMRMKKDVVPGRINSMLFEPNKLGTFEIFCAEYCGDSHSQMHSLCHVVTQAQYDAQVEKAANPYVGDDGVTLLPLAEVGKNLASLNGCTSCHTADGGPSTGPTWKDLYGATNHELADGSTITVDDAYIHESIRTPNAKVRKGFGPPSAMNPFPEGSVSDKDIGAIIEYQKSISQFAPKQTAGQPAAAPPPEKK